MLAAASAVAVFGAFVVVNVMVPYPGAAHPVGSAAVLFAIAGAAVFWAQKQPTPRPVTVEAQGGRLVVDGALVPVTDAVVSEAKGGTWRVAFSDARGRPAPSFVLATRAQADALARAALPPEGQRLAVFLLMPGGVARLVGIAWALIWFLCMPIVPLSRTIGGPFIHFTIFPIVLLMSVRMRVTVGNDGLHLSWIRVWNRYVSLAEVREAVVEKGRLVLRLRSGRVMRLGGRERRDTSSPAVARRVTALLGATLPGLAEAEALLAQGARSTAEWHESLRSLQAAGYRTAALSPTRLFALIEHPGASISARVGAALLLEGTLDEEGKARLRAFAASCVIPELRRALEASASAAETRGDSEGGRYRVGAGESPGDAAAASDGDDDAAEGEKRASLSG
jgi:hypothetical protein